MEPEYVAMKPPVDYKFLPGERYVTTIPYKARIFTEQPSSLEQMARLTSATSTNEIGMRGPSIAGLAFDIATHTLSTDDQLSTEGATHQVESPTPEHLRLYETLFGRDSLRVAIDLISSYPELARSTVLRLAELQGTHYDLWSEEKPGEILHEYHDPTDKIAQELTRDRGWKFPYYGSVDATPEFIRTLFAYCQLSEENSAFLATEYTDRDNEKRTIAYALDAALDCILRKLDNNPEGLLEFKAGYPTSIENQVWKDSWDAYHHADGTMANHDQGIASIEVQVTTYDALIDAAELYQDTLDDNAKARDLRQRAGQLKKSILHDFWTDDRGGYFVLGTDRDEAGRLRQMKVRTSNMGHALNSRLLEGNDPEIVKMREAVVKQITSPELLSDNGIRTLASDEVRYRPGAYHNGSIWLWDTHHIAKGLRRHGYNDWADDLDRRLLHDIEALKIFPEYIRGEDGPPQVNTETIILYDENAHRNNKVEQPPQEVQAWTVAAILAIKKRMARLGLFAKNH